MSTASARRARVLAITLSVLLPTYARVLWIPEVFEPNTGRLHSRQDAETCSTDASLKQCPSDFPPNFCCPAETACLQINTDDTSITAAICCPAGQNCEIIQPVACDQDIQDATQTPNSWLHSIPPQPLDACGNGCCPMGFSCNDNNQCTAEVQLSSKPSSSTPDATSPTALPGSTSTSEAASDKNHPAGVIGAEANDSFSSKSFAAGIVPGLAIGAIIAALIILCCIRKSRDRRRSSRYDSQYVEKNRDTLTDLSTLDGRPTMHGRSISAPTVDPAANVARTEFLRSSPTRSDDSYDVANHTRPMQDAPKTPANRTPRLKALLTSNAFANPTPSTPPTTQAPAPAHVKHGALSFQISPIRALKKQKSMHSLRRQMDESRTDSTETIQVLMSPEDEPSYKAEHTTPWPATQAPSRPQNTQQVPYASSSRYPSELQQQQFKISTPPPPVPRHQTDTAGRPSFLDSPYTPTKSQSKGALAVPPVADTRRETTFSTLMEKAGLRKSDLFVGSKNKVEGY